MSELEVHVPENLPARKFRGEIPELHRQSLDTRIQWLWNQRFGTVQTVWQKSTDMLDHTAATLILQAIMAKDLDSITLIFQRLEGGAVSDETLIEDPAPESMRL